MEITKVKPLTVEQLIISVDRLTRFKETEIKYLRVFFDIITSNLLVPKIKKSELEKLNYQELTSIAENIINYSLDCLNLKVPNSGMINKRISEYEKSIFYMNKNTEILLDNKINYDAFIHLLSGDIPKNLQWLKHLAYDNDIKKVRNDLSLKYPIEKVIIVEGTTEETLLPTFAAKCGYDFDKNGIYIISAGGKNQVVKLYYHLAEKLKVPIFVLLDKDAEENQEYINTKLRDSDKIHLLSCGEFEDLLPLELVKRTLEYELNNISIIEQEMLIPEEPMVKLLEDIFKTRGMHEFKKVEFAQMVRRNILLETDISAEIREIITEIKKI